MKVEDLEVVILLCVSLRFCMGVEIHRNYTFGEDCGVNTNEVQQYKPMLVMYRGKSFSGTSCREMIFKCKEDCKVCMNAKYFRDPDCAIKLEFKESSTAKTEHVIACNKNEKDEYCRSSSSSIIFSILSNKSPANAEFDLLVSSEVLEAGPELDGTWKIIIIVAVVGGVGIPMLCVIACVVFKFCVIHSSRKSRSPMYTPGNAVSMTNQSNTAFPNSGYSQYLPENYHTQQGMGRTSKF